MTVKELLNILPLALVDEMEIYRQEENFRGALCWCDSKSFHCISERIANKTVKTYRLVSPKIFTPRYCKLLIEV